MAGPPRPLLVVVTGRHRPHEIVFLVFAVMVGLAYTLGAPPPRSAAAEMPGWMVNLWALGLLFHGVFGLAGTLVPMRQDRGLWLELGSMLLGAGSLLVVGAASFSYAGSAALLGGGFSLAWMTANLARVGQIRLHLQALQAWFSPHPFRRFLRWLGSVVRRQFPR